MAQITDKEWFKIQGWMVNKLGLSGLELMTFALVASLSSGPDGLYKGGIMHLAKWLGCCRNSALQYLQSLEKKGLIEATRGMGKNGRFCHYRVVQNLDYPQRKKCTTPVQNLDYPYREQTGEQKRGTLKEKSMQKRTEDPVLQKMRSYYAKQR